MRLAVISIALAIISCISAMSQFVLYIVRLNIGVVAYYTEVSVALNVFTPLCILVGFLVALIGLFSKGANLETRRMCGIAFVFIVFSLWLFITLNSINGIV